MHSLKILCPNDRLGFASLSVESFLLGAAERADFIAADSGGDDIGPVPLGSDCSASPHLQSEGQGGDVVNHFPLASDDTTFMRKRHVT